ncbi:hypothetical protein [Motilimonas eburnea]|uniref:hypothetical protein n=1 Tax=Motilimonas eburnea TaxID=1737488 RepID=UPI001E653D95|nr:hypothetical protein [Motilimonas eburnea]MCE2573856.1 hypothetical protein [Motilimonas eburnea]
MSTTKKILSWLHQRKLRIEVLTEISAGCRQLGMLLFLVGIVAGVYDFEQINSSMVPVFIIAGVIIWAGGIYLVQVKSIFENKDGSKD